MANIKWSGIESSKYGLIARWYVSAYYGNDVDVDSVGYYNPSTNPTGHGGPTRPFATIGKTQQDSNVLSGAVIVIDSGRYTYGINFSKRTWMIGDGTVILDSMNFANASVVIYNLSLLSCGGYIGSAVDCTFIYCTGITSNSGSILRSCIFIESNFVINQTIFNCSFFHCSGSIGINGVSNSPMANSIIVDSPSLYFYTLAERPAGNVIDYNTLIGTVKSGRTINGKTTAITVEDFKIDGNYFTKSFSEVDLFGNASGSGATVSQLQTLFNNYFSPVYLDTWQYLDLSLKLTSNEKIRFGGVNGTYIGARPVGYHFTAQNLFSNRNTSNSSNIEIDSVTGYLQIVGTNEVGVLETNEIDLGSAVVVDPIMFRANLVYNNDGTAKQGVANQRIDTTPDLLPDNTKNQRVVYDFELAYSPDGTTALTAFKNFELNRKPEVDASGRSQLDDNYVSTTSSSITIRRFKLKVTLRKIIIE